MTPRTMLSMMSPLRRFLLVLSIFVTAALVSSMAGCGGGDDTTPPADDDAGTSTTTKDGSVPFDGATDTGAGDASKNDAGSDSATTDAADDGATDGATDAEVDGAADADAGPLPTLSIDQVSNDEGSSGTSSFTFTVTLSAASTSPVTVDFATADGTASSTAGAVGGADFAAANGTLTFAPGDTSKTITVTVNGDAVNEADETFTVTLTNPSGATLATATGTGTIVNDDSAPTVSIADALLTEGNTGTTPATFTVTLSAASGQTVSVHYQTNDGSASAGSDYTAVADTTLTFAPGETSKDVSVDVVGDTTIEPNETFSVVLSQPTNATLGAPATGTATIQNDDGATQPSISIADATVTEGNAGTKILTFDVTASAAGAQVVTVDFATSDGTATTAGNDYQATSGTITFGLGETAKQISVVIVGDTANEDDETFTVTLSNPKNAIVQTASATGTIQNDDAVPTVTINNVSVAEGQAGTTAMTFTATLSAASGKTVSVDFATADGTATTGGSLATGGQDYTATSGTATFAPGVTTASVTVQVAGDTLNEADETLTVALSNAVNAALGGAAVGTGTVTNDDALPLIVITGDAQSEGNSGTSPLTFTVSLVDATSNPAPSGRTVTVDFATKNGTALAGSDYTANSGTLSFAAGETQKQIVVQMIGDTVAEAAETLTVGLSNPVNAAIQTGTATGTIQNDDGNLPLLNIDDQSITEGNAGTQTMTFNVTLSAASAQNVTVSYATQDGTAVAAGTLATGGKDYVAKSGTLTFAPGELSKTIAITIDGDVANEADETFSVVLSNPSTTAQIQNGTGTGTILNDDAVPTLSIADASLVEGNAGKTNMSFTVTLSAISGRTVSVSYATADDTAVTTGLIVAGGTDYTAKTGTLTFSPGQTTKTILVPITGDTTLEPDETFTVTLATPINAAITDDTGVGTIVNDDTAPTMTITDVTLAEGTPAPNTADTTPFVFTVKLSSTSSDTVTVAYASANGTASVAGKDYFPAIGTLTFLPGETTKTITVLVRKDIGVEGNETFFVNLSGAVGATLSDAQGQGTITNDD